MSTWTAFRTKPCVFRLCHSAFQFNWPCARARPRGGYVRSVVILSVVRPHRHGRISVIAVDRGARRFSHARLTWLKARRTTVGGQGTPVTALVNWRRFPINQILRPSDDSILRFRIRHWFRLTICSLILFPFFPRTFKVLEEVLKEKNSRHTLCVRLIARR